MNRSATTSRWVLRHTKTRCVLPISHFSECVDRRGLCPPAQAIVVFKIDKDEWTLDLRPGKGSLKKGPSADKVNLTLTVNSANFVQLYVQRMGGGAGYPGVALSVHWLREV